jgi:DNA-binding beta-propeller fold protein YncE
MRWIPRLFAVAALVATVVCHAQTVRHVKADLAEPFGVAFDAKGNLLIIEYTSSLRALTPAGKVVTLCGDGTKGDGGDGGPATAAKLNSPHALAVGAEGVVYIADSLNHRVRAIDPKTKVITTFAGTGKGYGGDGGPAAKARFSGIYCISFNPAKDKMVVTDLDNRRVRVIDMASGVVSLVAGNGKKGVPPDGAVATDAPLVDPRAATMDAKGNVYLLERGGHALRVVDPAGKIRTLIPPGTIKGPKHLCVDRNDDVIIADTDNHRIVKWLAAEGKLVPLAGTGKKGAAGVGGPPEKLEMNQPHGVYLDEKGELYICDSMNNRVLRIGG